MKLSSPLFWILVGVVAYLAYQQGYNSANTANALAASQFPVMPGGGV